MAPKTDNKPPLRDNTETPEYYANDIAGFLMCDSNFHLIFAVHRIVQIAPPVVVRLPVVNIALSRNALLELHQMIANIVKDLNVAR